MIVADSYDETRNVSTLTLLPYGNIEISGNWTKIKDNFIRSIPKWSHWNYRYRE